MNENMKLSKIAFFVTFFAFLFAINVKANDKDMGPRLKEILGKKNVSMDELDAVREMVETHPEDKSLDSFLKILIEEGLAHEHPTVFLKCYESLLFCEREGVYSALASMKLTRYVNKSPEVITAIMLILKESNRRETWKACLPFVGHKNRAIGTAATELAGQGVREAIRPLIKNIEKYSGRRLTISLRVLEKLTGENFRDSAIVAKQWYEEKKKNMPESFWERKQVVSYFEDKKLTKNSYFGTPVEYANTMFCMDTSLSMRPEKEIPLKKSYESKFPILPEGNGSKIWEARRTLCTTLKNMVDKIKIGVIVFGGRIDGWKRGKMIESTLASRIDAYTWVLTETPLTHGTLIAQSLVGALKQNDVENIFLLTDGFPFRPRDPNLITKGDIPFRLNSPFTQNEYFNDDFIVDWCRRAHIVYRVTIHTVGVGTDGRGLLTKIASAADGTFKFVDAEVKKKKK